MLTKRVLLRILLDILFDDVDIVLFGLIKRSPQIELSARPMQQRDASCHRRTFGIGNAIFTVRIN